jgi:hypothetical protein
MTCHDPESRRAAHSSPYAQARQDPLRLQAMLSHPETAVDWSDYVARFDGTGLEAPYMPKIHDITTFRFEWLVMFKTAPPGGPGSRPTEVWLLSWLDLWVYFCLSRQVPLADAVKGPCGGWDLGEEFAVRRVHFGL